MSKGIKKAKEVQEEQEENTRCKYCGCPIPAHLFCCNSCYQDFEDLEEEDSNE